MQCARLLEQRYRQRRTAALPQTQPQIEQRRRFERLQHSQVPRFGGAMGEQQPGPTRRVQAHRAKRRDAADVAVHQRRDTLLSTGEIGAGQRRHFEAAKPAQGFQRHAAMPGMQPHGALDDLFLVSNAGHIQARPRPDQGQR